MRHFGTLDQTARSTFAVRGCAQVRRSFWAAGLKGPVCGPSAPFPFKGDGTGRRTARSGPEAPVHCTRTTGLPHRVDYSSLGRDRGCAHYLFNRSHAGVVARAPIVRRGPFHARTAGVVSVTVPRTYTGTDVTTDELRRVASTQ